MSHLRKGSSDIGPGLDAVVEAQYASRIDHQWNNARDNKRGDKQGRERIETCPAGQADQNRRYNDSNAPKRILEVPISCGGNGIK